jgi:hypothetical protein
VGKYIGKFFASGALNWIGAFLILLVYSGFCAFLYRKHTFSEFLDVLRLTIIPVFILSAFLPAYHFLQSQIGKLMELKSALDELPNQLSEAIRLSDDKLREIGSVSLSVGNTISQFTDDFINRFESLAAEKIEYLSDQATGQSEPGGDCLEVGGPADTVEHPTPRQEILDLVSAIRDDFYAALELFNSDGRRIRHGGGLFVVQGGKNRPELVAALNRAGLVDDAKSGYWKEVFDLEFSSRRRPLDKERLAALREMRA